MFVLQLRLRGGDEAGMVNEDTRLALLTSWSLPLPLLRLLDPLWAVSVVGVRWRL